MCNLVVKADMIFSKKLQQYYSINKNSNYNEDRTKASSSLSLVNSIDNRLIQLNKKLNQDLKMLTKQTTRA